jgi:hypothetical protein
MSGVRNLNVGSARFQVITERRITRSQRSVVATAYDADGVALAIAETNTGSARGYLHRDTEAEPATWEEMENIATDLLRVQLEE